MFLDLDQVTLQLREILVGLEVGIGLLQREQAAERLFQCRLHCAKLRRALQRDRLRAQLRHRFQDRAFVSGISLHGRDQLRHEVVATHQLHVDVGPCGARLVAQAHEAVEGEHDPRQQRGDNQNGQKRHVVIPCDVGAS